LLSDWRSNDYAPKLKERTVLFVSGKDCISLESRDGDDIVATNVEALRSNQEEADIRRHSPSNAIITVRSPHTDVFILLLHFTSLHFFTGTNGAFRHRNRRQEEIDHCQTGCEKAWPCPSLLHWM